MWSLISLAVASSAQDGDCYVDPSICGVKPFQQCISCGAFGRDPTKGCCISPPSSADCYMDVGICGKTKWCQLNDRKSWNETDKSTKGRCVEYQSLCYTCTSTYEEDNPPTVPGINAYDFYSETEPTALGSLLTRETRCDPRKHVCTGKYIPQLPATCVVKRTLPKEYNPPTVQMMYMWAKRMIRMGALDNFNATPGLTPQQQKPQGNTRADIQDGVNMILRTLWNKGVWGVFKPVEFKSTFDEPCCEWANYSSQLTDFQGNRTGVYWRNPLMPLDPYFGNPPSCVFCQRDGSYNDENPAIWSLIHALTFNLEDKGVSEEQFQVLQSLPLFLRQHLSCSLCRSHVDESIVSLGIPTTRKGVDWAKFWWRAHNNVNERSGVTRCGSQKCGFGIFQDPPSYRCAGVYRNPWFMEFAEASKQWRLTAEDRYDHSHQAH